MPTGYTADIPKGISFEEYALRCARAFGALVMMRDDPTDAPIPKEFEPSSYHKDAIEKASTELKAVEAMSAEECDKASHDEWEKSEVRRVERLHDHEHMRIAYTDMLALCKSWEPPSPDHVEMKKFMISQIEESIRFDCHESHMESPAEKLSGESWRQQKLEKIARDFSYHSEEWEKELQRTRDRNKWIAQLRLSLGITAD